MLQRPFLAAVGLVACLCALQRPLPAQSFALAPARIPAGSPFNNSYSENIDCGDVDLDGDFDVVSADGGDAGNDQNRIWINLGGIQGGAIGFFQDETATRFPAVLDQSRDVELGDIDGDGDLDLQFSNTSTLMNQPNRFWINAGGTQGGSPGFFVEETAIRWIGLGGPGSSIAPALVLPGGGFRDWSCDSDFGDLDNDGDLDLVHSSYGQTFTGTTPTRIFLNDGAGRFSEFNPSGFQLAGAMIASGDPGLWCEGTQQANTSNATGSFCDVASVTLDVELGDIDGDLDLDLLHGDRNSAPRMFRNRLQENGGSLGFRDVTGVVFPAGYTAGGGNYEQEMGDLDDDDDLDIYGVNWASSFVDVTLENLGTGSFANIVSMAGSGADDNEGDCLDYDGDGDLDVFVANFSGQDRLYRNNASGVGISLSNVTSQLPFDNSNSLDADACDLDGDGDYDVLVANGFSQPNTCLENITQIADVHAPRFVNLEQAPDRMAGPAPTVVRVHVYDNAPYYVTWYDDVRLLYRVNGGPQVLAGTSMSSGQVFRGELPGVLLGRVEYQVVGSDRYGNQGTSVLKSYTATGACSGAVMAYCTATTSSSGCVPSIGSLGAPSPGSGFVLTGAAIEAQQPGMLFHGLTGPASQPFGGGTLCVQPPLGRHPVQFSGGGGPCTGAFVTPVDGLLASLPAGTDVWAQYGFRDPGAASSMALSDGLRFTICP